MKKTIVFWLMFLLAICIAVYFSVHVAMIVMGRDRALVVRRIHPTEYAELIPQYLGRRTYSVRLSDVLGRISESPDIESASVRRMGNGDLYIRIKKFVAVAFVADGDKFYPVTAEGVRINEPRDAPTDGALVFRGDLPKNLSGIVRTIYNFPSIRTKIEHLEWTENRRWDVFAKNGIKIMLSEESPDISVSKLAELDARDQIMDRGITVLDLRDPARTMVKIK